ncbi:endonuclease III domain-containing protein, partial [Candidatus Woesearchaeota archaeon]|nr:endonuclease III domain-containing protein [Candidatus Woesearchaeota archaeon]
ELRQKLLSLKGIGPETADSIILYSAEKPIFVVDAYTKRIFSRLGFCDENVKYADLQDMFLKSLKHDNNIFKEYHALLVEHAKHSCKKGPVCNDCLLLKNCSSYPKTF